MTHYEVEYRVGRVQMIPSNILVQDVTDMEALEFWEDRLKALEQPFTVAFRRHEGKCLYAIFTDLRKRATVFR